MRTLIYLPSVFRILSLCAVFFLVTSASAKEKQFDNIVVFGSSLSDSGNAFTILSDPESYDFEESCNLGTPANVPPYDKLDDLLIPDGSYAKGGHHVSNGATWIEQFSRSIGLSGNTRPALGNEGSKASNYAVGGARALDYPCRFNLSSQLSKYLEDTVLPTENTLFVLEIGGNDVRDALALQDPAIIGDALNNIAYTIQVLYAQGARKFLLLNVPAIGETPALKILDGLIPGVAQAANNLTKGYNYNLGLLQDSLNTLPQIDIRTLDLYSLLNNIIANPENFGITNTTDACVTPHVPPFTCKKPDSYLFWDGIHPTKAVHAIMAQQAAEVLN